MSRNLSFWEAVFVIIGTQIGAGILALPYVLSHLGFFWGAVVLFVAAFFSVITAVMLVEALYLTNPRYHYFDLATRYLGRWGGVLVLLLLYSGYTSMLAYVGALGQVFASAASYYGLTSLSSPLAWSVGLWAVISILAYFGLKRSGGFESILAFFIVLLVLTIFLWSVPHMHPYFGRVSLGIFATAFSVSIFAFYSHSIIPEVVQGVRNMGKTVWAIVSAFLISFSLYLLFSYAIMGTLGTRVPEIGTLGLTKLLDPELAFIGFLLPMITVLTSFLSVSVAQTDILQEVFRHRLLAWVLALVPVVLLYLLGVSGFVAMITLSSLGMLAASGIIPPLVLLRARKERRRRLTPISSTLVYVTLAVYAVFFLFTIVSAV